MVLAPPEKFNGEFLDEIRLIKNTLDVLEYPLVVESGIFIKSSEEMFHLQLKELTDELLVKAPAAVEAILGGGPNETGETGWNDVVTLTPDTPKIPDTPELDEKVKEEVKTLSQGGEKHSPITAPDPRGFKDKIKGAVRGFKAGMDAGKARQQAMIQANKPAKSELARKRPAEYAKRRGELASQLAHADVNYADAENAAMGADQKLKRAAMAFDAGDMNRKDFNAALAEHKESKNDWHGAMANYAQAYDSVVQGAEKLETTVDQVALHVERINNNATGVLPPSADWPEAYGGAKTAQKLRKNLEGDSSFGAGTGRTRKYGDPSKGEGAEAPLPDIAQAMQRAASEAEKEASKKGIEINDTNAAKAMKAYGFDADGNAIATPEAEKLRAQAHEQMQQGTAASGAGVESADREYLDPGQPPPDGVREQMGDPDSSGRKSRFYSKREAAMVKHAAGQKAKQVGAEAHAGVKTPADIKRALQEQRGLEEPSPVEPVAEGEDTSEDKIKDTSEDKVPIEDAESGAETETETEVETETTGTETEVETEEDSDGGAGAWHVGGTEGGRNGESEIKPIGAIPDPRIVEEETTDEDTEETPEEPELEDMTVDQLNEGLDKIKETIRQMGQQTEDMDFQGILDLGMQQREMEDRLEELTADSPEEKADKERLRKVKEIETKVREELGYGSGESVRRQRRGESIDEMAKRILAYQQALERAQKQAAGEETGEDSTEAPGPEEESFDPGPFEPEPFDVEGAISPIEGPSTVTTEATEEVAPEAPEPRHSDVEAADSRRQSVINRTLGIRALTDEAGDLQSQINNRRIMPPASAATKFISTFKPFADAALKYGEQKQESDRIFNQFSNAGKTLDTTAKELKEAQEQYDALGGKKRPNKGKGRLGSPDYQAWTAADRRLKAAGNASSEAIKNFQYLTRTMDESNKAFEEVGATLDADGNTMSALVASMQDLKSQKSEGFLDTDMVRRISNALGFLGPLGRALATQTSGGVGMEGQPSSSIGTGSAEGGIAASKDEIEEILAYVDNLISLADDKSDESTDVINRLDRYILSHSSR